MGTAAAGKVLDQQVAAGRGSEDPEPVPEEPTVATSSATVEEGPGSCHDVLGLAGP